MNTNKKTKLWVRLVCWILVGMMLISVATYLIYTLLGLM